MARKDSSHKSQFNGDKKATKSFTDRMVAIESAFQEAKADRDESIKDLKAEIKSREAETGVSPADIKRLCDIRLKEQEHREELEAQSDAMLTYDMLYGKSKPDDDDPLA